MSDRPATPDTRFTSTLFLVAAALLVVANLTHPVDAEPSPTSRLELATSDAWMPVHLALALALVLVACAFAAFQRVVLHPAGAPYARFAATTGLIGGTSLAIVFGASDGYGTSSLAPAWQTATGDQRVMLEGAAIALDATDSGMTALGIIALFGLTIGACGLAILVSRVLSPWLGRAAVAIGVAGLVTGVLFALEGPTSLTINVLFRPVAMAATIWFVALGVALRRLAVDAPADATVRQGGRVAATASS